MSSTLLSSKEGRAITRLSERACGDLGCGSALCEDIRTTVVVVRRLLARLTIIRKAVNAELKEPKRDDDN